MLSPCLSEPTGIVTGGAGADAVRFLSSAGSRGSFPRPFNPDGLDVLVLGMTVPEDIEACSFSLSLWETASETLRELLASPKNESGECSELASSITLCTKIYQLNPLI